MRNTFKRITLVGMVFLISISLASLALATPPGLAKKKANSEIQQVKEEIKFVPPGLQAKRTPPGLVNKGGLPPGMHGRSLDELPPGIRYNPNFQEAIEKLKEKEIEQEKEFILTVAGGESIIIPAEDFVTTTYKAFLKDADDNEEEVAATWEIKNAVTGVSIDEEDGILKVTASAVPGTITVIANYTTGEGDAEKSYTGSVTVELYNQEVSEIILSGQDFYTIQGNETEPLRFEYTATVKDQQGKVMAGESVSWSTISTDYEDISIAINGNLIVEIPAREGKFTVKASNGGVEATLLVTIYHSTVTSIEIAGPQLVTLKDEDETPLSLEYSATVKDQQGRAMAGERVSWSTISTDFDITIKVNGNLTVEAPATDGIFTVIANSGEVTSTLVVTVYTPAVVSIELQGDKFVALQEDDEELLLEYVATVKDQKDQVIEGLELTWSANADTEFILDNGELTLTELPEAGDEIVFDLVAEYTVNTEIIKSNTLTVTIYHTVVDNIIITGAAEITLPATEEVTKKYKAVILDQHGQKIEAEVVWILTDEDGAELEVTGVTLDNGALTVTNEASKGFVWIWVVYGEDVYDSFIVEIV